jgi:hypothetical protein
VTPSGNFASRPFDTPQLAAGLFIPPPKLISFYPLSYVILASSQLVSNDQAMICAAAGG